MSTARRSTEAFVRIGKSEIRPIRTGRAGSTVRPRTGEESKADDRLLFIPAGTPKASHFTRLNDLKKSLHRSATGRVPKK